jgi:TPR repeat protein
VEETHTCGAPPKGDVLTCTSAAPKGCTDLALAAENKKKFSLAVELYERGCDADEPSACNNLAFVLSRGAEGVAVDREKALTLYEKACSLSYGKGCMNRGAAYTNANPPELTKALEYYAKACDLKEATACVIAGWAYAEGRGTAPSDDVSYQMFKKGCDEGNERACGAMGSRIALGLGVAKDVERGGEMMRVACDTGAGEACKNLGALILDGKLGPKDAEKAHEAFEKGCKAGEGGACKMVGNNRASGTGTKTDLPGALEAYRAGCDVNDVGACILAGQMLRDGKGSEKNPTDAAKLFEKACKAGSGAGCEAFGVALFMTKDARATDATTDACKKGRGASCRAIIERNLTAKTTPDQKALDAIIETETTTCKSEPAGCISLATLVEIGWTTEDKAGKTETVLTKGCDQHDGLSCAKLFWGHVGGKYTLTSAALRTIAPDLEKNCEDARALVCAAWGTALKKGLGVAKDETKGAQVYDEACAHRSIDCTELPP